MMNTPKRASEHKSKLFYEKRTSNDKNGEFCLERSISDNTSHIVNAIKALRNSKV